MSQALFTPVKESQQELRALLKKSIPFLQPRITLLMAIKRHGNSPVSKRTLMDETGFCSYSVHKWRTLYGEGGIEKLLQHNKKGFKPRRLTADQHKLLESKLKNPENGIRGYKELQQWVLSEMKTEIAYNTLLKYCVKHFGTKIKVARKYHAKKDENRVDTFKTTSLQSAKKQ